MGVFELVKRNELYRAQHIRVDKSSSWSIWLIALGAAMWGLDAVFIVALLHHLTSTQIVWLEHGLLLSFSVPVLIMKWHEVRRLGWKDWLAVLFIAWGGSAIASILFTQAFVHGNANVVLILQKLQPLFAVLMATWLLQERMRLNYGLVFIAAVFGAYLLAFGFHLPSHTRGGGLAGALFALGAAALWGGSTVMGKVLVGKVSFVTTTALRFAVAFPFLTVVVLLQHPVWSSIGHGLVLFPVWANLLFQTIVPSLASLLIYYQGLQGVRASYATLAELAFPATGLVVNYLVLRQTFTLGQASGFLIIWIAVFCLAKMRENVTFY